LAATGGGARELYCTQHIAVANVYSRDWHWRPQDCNNTAGALVQQLLSVNFTQPPYCSAYP
jgi:hypothetical protein